MTTPYGRYELVKRLATGGMAEVFLARSPGVAGFERELVVKRMLPHMADDRRLVDLFQFEARLLSQLCHPNIPQVYELGQMDDCWFMAMEYVPGMSVSELWQAGARVGRPMPLPVAVGLVCQVAEALHHAHERRDRDHRPLRVVHRDVTPHNVMVTEDGSVKLLDFGVAQTAARRDTNAGTLRGTLAYMAPEQVRGRKLDKRADVFALGVLLYELTTGTRLYRGPDVQIMTKIVEEDPPPPSVRVPNYPRDLEEVVMSALVRPRARRLASAANLAGALEKLALRNGLEIGPRAVARYVRTVTAAIDGGAPVVEPDNDGEEITTPVRSDVLSAALVAAASGDDAETLSSGELPPVFLDDDPPRADEAGDLPTAPRMSRDDLVGLVSSIGVDPPVDAAPRDLPVRRFAAEPSDGD